MKHDSDRPIIEWDDDTFGGFRVVKNLDRFNVPGDWVVDTTDPSHFMPKYKPCKYRRLSYGVRSGQPWCHIHCLLFEEVVDHQTCVDCTERVDPPNFVNIKDLVHVEEGDTDEDIDRKFDKFLQDERREEDPDDLDDVIILTDIATDVEHDDLDVDPVFSRDQPPSRYVRKPEQKQATPWAPCVHRQQESKESKEDCSGCKKFVCGCEACPLLGRTLNKKDCKECLHRTET